MGSIFYMERNGQRYAYESTSVRVPGRKNPKTIKTYLGKVDPETGEIIPKEPRNAPHEEHAKSYGPVMFLDWIQKGLGIFDDLRSVFANMAPDIMGAAMAMAINPTSFNSLHYTVDGSAIKETMKLRGTLSPPVIGELSEKVGSMMVTMDNFFSKRIERSSGDLYSMGLTSVSMHPGIWNRVRFGDDCEDLERTDIALVTDMEGIPVMFRMLPGPMSDIGILRHAVDDMGGLDCRGRLVIGSGFESAKNVSALIDMGVDFTMPSDAKAEPMRKLMTRAVKEMTSSSSFAYHNRATYKYVEYEVGIVDLEDGNSEYVVQAPHDHKGSDKSNEPFPISKKLKAFVVYDPRKAASDIDAVMSMVNGVESELENTVHDDPATTYAKLPSSVRRFLDFEVDEQGFMHIVRKQNAFTFADNRAGMSVILSSAGTTWEQMMTSYDVRDRVRGTFEVYGTCPDGERDRAGNAEGARGRFFIRFIAMMLRARIQNRLGEHDEEVRTSNAERDSVNGMTVDEVLLSLNTVFAIGNTGNWRLTAISKNVREIFAVFGLEPPKSGQIILG